MSHLPLFRSSLVAAALGGAFLHHGAASAHFVLSAPPASLQQDDLGNPQKTGPCGQDGTGVETGVVTAYQAGETITITIDETITHPGHYRVALALNDSSELPDPPPVEAGNTDCGSVPIMNPPVFPVLADGIFEHTEAFGEPQSIEITLPDDVSCDNCTLQVLEFMAEHGAPCFYYHCATISIAGGAADGSTSASGGDAGSSEGGGSSDGGEGTSGASSASATVTDGGSASASGASAGDASASGGVGTDASESSTGAASDGDDDSGCSCTADRERSLAPAAWLVGFLLVARRRRAT